MVGRHLKNGAVVLRKEANSYILQRPELKGLVLSGGGARGLAYVGMYKTLHETKALAQLTNVAGASAGAMTASLIALGTSPEDFESISTQIDMNKLIDMSLLNGRSDGSRFKNVLQLMYFFQFKEKLSLVDKDKLSGMQKWYMGDLEGKVQGYVAALERLNLSLGKSINDLSELLNFIHSDEGGTENFAALNDVLQSVPEFTFKDLTLLRNVLPVDQQHCIKDLSVAATNKTERQQVVYSNVESPDYSLAAAVMQSGAHPLMFRGQRDKNNHVISDGGVLDNMPTETLERLGLDKQEILCVKVNQASQISDQLRRTNSAKVEKPTLGNKIFDAVLSPVLGGEHKTLSMQTREREKVFYDMGNMLFLNSGDITATTTQLTDAQRKFAIDNGQESTLDMINDRDMRFTNCIEALLFVGEDELKEMVMTLKEEEDPKFFQAAVVATVILNYQKKVVELLKASPLFANQRDDVRTLLMELQYVITQESNLEDVQNMSTFALSLKQINFTTEGKLSQFLDDDIKLNPDSGHWAMKLLVLIATPFHWLVNYFIGRHEDYQKVSNQDLDNSNHAKDIKSFLNSGERLFDREPSKEPRDAMIELPEDMDIKPSIKLIG